MPSYKVPATSANIGPGFDCLGMAVNIYNTISFDEIDSGLDISVTGDGSDVIPLDESNMAYETAKYFFDKVGYTPKGLKIQIHNYIPIARGLGSSSSIVVGSLLCANDIAKTNFSMQEILNIANEIEGHPDNVTPALVGSITASVILDGKVEYKKITPPDMLDTIVLIPSYEMSTAQARKILPRIYDREDLFKDYNGLVILVRVLPFDVNLGYSELENKIITKVNGQKYKDFNDFVQKVKNTNSEFIVFEDEDSNEIVLDVAKVKAQKAELMDNYNISHEMSSDIR